MRAGRPARALPRSGYRDDPAGTHESYASPAPEPGGTLMRRAAQPASLLALLALACTAIAAPPTTPLSADIPPQTLEHAIQLFQELTHLNVNWPHDFDASRVQSPGARAGLAPQAALRELLRNSGLEIQTADEHNVKLQWAPPPPPAEAQPPPESPLEEVRVSASRWDRQLTRQPVDVVDLDPHSLEYSGIKALADVGALIPGVDFGFFSSVGSGVYTDVIIRGVSDRHGSTTGLYLDDVPLPAARSNTFGRAPAPYFDLADIEILPGPQGALLGADTQGGAVRFISRQPNLETAGGYAHAEWATTARGDPSYEAGAAYGGPIEAGELGFRVSAWYRSDGGYVSLVDPFQCAPSACTILDPNDNDMTSRSFRAALTYQDPTGRWHITPSIDYSSASSADSPAFFTYLSDPGAGELYNGSLIPQPFKDSFYLASVRARAELGWAELESVTAYYQRKGDLIVDDTESVKWGPPGIGWNNPLGLGPAYPASYSNLVTTYTRLRQSMFSQELRLASPIDTALFTWNAGISYADTRDTEAYRVTGQYVPILGGPLDLSASTTTTPERLAAYGQLSRTFGRFTLRAALRIEHEQYESSTPPPLAFQGSANATLGIPALSLFYMSDKETLYYVSAAKGYSPAGVDAALPTCFQAAQPYPTDTLWGYELGVKHGLSADAPRFYLTLFDSRWDNGPDMTRNCLVTHIPGTAESRGFELKAAQAIGALRAALELTYIDARYTETLGDGAGHPLVQSGDALGTPPLVAAPWNALLSLEQSFTPGRLVVIVHAEDAFHSHNDGPFYTGIPGPYFAPGLAGDPATNIVNLRASFSRGDPGSADRLELSLFVNNLFDSQPTLLKRNKGVDVSTLYYATTFRPRTIGVAGTWQF